MNKTSTKLKICGITQNDQALEIASLGVYAIGLIYVKTSPRFISALKVNNIFNDLKSSYPEVKRVLVVSDIIDEELEKVIIGKGSPSIIQLHGNESPERCQELKNRYPAIKWWKAFRIKSQEDLKAINSYESIVDSTLLDPWDKDQLGGTGKRLDIELLKNQEFKNPWWLAGGISAECIREVLNNLNPFGIDASSKLEKSPGIKDIQKVKDLIKEITPKNY